MPYKGDFKVSLRSFFAKQKLAWATTKSGFVGFVYTDTGDIVVIANLHYLLTMTRLFGDAGRYYNISLKEA